MTTIKRVPLAEALRSAPVFVDGDWIESKDQNPKGDVRLIQLADIGIGSFINKSRRFLTGNTARRLGCTFLERGDVLIARMPDPIGRACVFPGIGQPAVTAVDVCIVRVNPEVIDSRYLVHFLNSTDALRQISSKASGSTRQRISRSNLGTISIPLPPLEEQRRIAAILDKADQIKQLDSQVKAKNKSLLRSIFIDHFGNPSTNKMHWETGSVRDTLKLINGRAFKSSEWCTEGLPIIRIANVKRASEPFNCFNGTWDPSHLVQNGDILLCWAGQLVSIGVHKWRRGKGLLNQHIFKVEPKIKFDPEFLTFSLGLVIERAKENFRGIEMKHLTKADLNREKLIIPPLEKQEKFGTIVRQIENMEKKNSEKSKKYQDLISSLQVQLLTNTSNLPAKTKMGTNDQNYFVTQ